MDCDAGDIISFVKDNESYPCEYNLADLSQLSKACLEEEYITGQSPKKCRLLYTEQLSEGGNYIGTIQCVFFLRRTPYSRGCMLEF